MSRMHKIRNRREKRRRYHVRKKIEGSAERPRFTVQKSLRHMYAQLIDDGQGVTLAMVSSVNFSFEKSEGKQLTKVEQSALIGTALAARAKEQGITKVVFDRNHNLYHGRIKAVAEAARKEGLKF